jgi:hypothetical protein
MIQRGSNLRVIKLLFAAISPKWLEAASALTRVEVLDFDSVKLRHWSPAEVENGRKRLVQWCSANENLTEVTFDSGKKLPGNILLYRFLTFGSR